MEDITIVVLSNAITELQENGMNMSFSFFWIMASQASVETGKTLQWIMQLEHPQSTESSRMSPTYSYSVQGPNLALSNVLVLVWGHSETSN